MTTLELISFALDRQWHPHHFFGESYDAPSLSEGDRVSDVPDLAYVLLARGWRVPGYVSIKIKRFCSMLKCTVNSGTPEFGRS
jgi:hypothetical protein